MTAADLVAGARALISRLRARPLYEGYGEWSDLPDDAADAIRALLDDRDALTQRLEALMSFSRPFADALDIECDFMTPPAPFEDGFDVRARARAVMLADEVAQ